MRRITFWSTVSLVAFVFSITHAKTEDAFHFSIPKVCKLDWNTRSLVSEDLNGDGRKDLLVLNNDQGRINIFYQKTDELKTPEKVSLKKNRWDPVLSDHPFVPSFVVTGVSMLSLAVGDVDGDGLKDLIFTTKDSPLMIRFQSENGDFLESLTFSQKIRAVSRSDAIQILDFDEDGRNEIMLSTQNSLLMIRVENDRQFGEVKEYQWSSNPVYWKSFKDINDDGLKDLLYYTDGSQMRPLRVRYQLPNAELSQEYGILMNPQNTMHLLNDDRYFAGINRKSGSIEIKELITKEGDNSLEALMSHAVFPIASVDSMGSYTMGDLDQDGSLDILIANPEEASIQLIKGKENQSGLEFSEQFPTLKGVDFMSIGDFQNQDIPQILIFSTHENLMGLSDYNTDQGIVFPSLLEFEDDLICATAADTDNNGLHEIIWISKNRSQYKLHNSEWDKKSENWNTRDIDLGKISRKPESIFMFDLDKNDSQDLLILTSREPIRIFQNSGKRNFNEVLEKSPTRMSLLEDILSENLGKGDIDQDGKEELLVGSEGFVRAFSLKQDGSELIVHGQYNAREGSSLLRIPFLTKSKKGRPVLVAYDKKDRAFQFLQNTKSGFEFYTQRSVDSINPLGIWNIASNERQKYIILTSDRLLYLDSEQPYLQITNNGYYETFLKDIRHTELIVGNFNKHSNTDIIAYDGLNHALEVLESDDDEYSSWQSKMHFNIFETNLHYKGPQGAQFEPRESLTSDLNNDGKDDFALLIHDRILIYFQK